jgi:opacity protein-like surface antigen
MRHHIWILLAALLLSSVSRAQSSPPEVPKFEFFGGFLDTGEFSYSDFKFTGFTLPGDFGTHHGFEVSVIRDLAPRFGIKGDFSAHFQNNSGAGNVCLQTPCVAPVQEVAQLNPRMFTFLGGPEIRLGNRRWRVSPFTYALAGIAHASATFKISGSAFNLSQTSTETGFAAAVGGGVDVRITRRFSARTSVDFNPNWVGRDDSGARQVQKDLRFAVGVLFH